MSQNRGYIQRWSAGCKILFKSFLVKTAVSVD